MIEKRLVLRIHDRLITYSHPRKPEPQHGAAAVKRRQGVADLVQKRTVALVGETGIRRRDEIRACIGQCPVEIEDNGFHIIPRQNTARHVILGNTS